LRKHTLSGDAYQFLQKSEIPSYHFQKSLRRLPIPKLERTCERFLAAAEAVLHEIRFMGLKSVVDDFRKTEGPQLQKELMAYDRLNKHTSYISQPWFDMYLSDRLPCPVNYNPFMTYSPDPNTVYNDQWLMVCDSGMLVSPEQVHACLAMILSDATTKLKANECVGSLTSLNRDRWAEVREELSSIGENAASLHTIDSALFALCLDSLDSEDPRRLIRSLLYGDDASNRWFDKCFQLIVDARGQATINFEHSWGDGVAVLRLMEESFRDTNKNHFVDPKQRVDTTVDISKHCRQISQGFDRHLMGLRVTAERLGRKPPALFSHPDFKYLSEFVISTSTLTTDTICFGGFGPVVRDGFGIGYVVSSSKLGAVISSYRDKRNAESFANSLLESLDIIKAIMMKN
uniref:Carn_acyltransf domain-containing protein n=1 Tax=Ascaris lumbricoides TaxID=6252 RepID=A0A0M3IGR6_ASCLU